MGPGIIIREYLNFQLNSVNKIYEDSLKVPLNLKCYHCLISSPPHKTTVILL